MDALYQDPALAAFYDWDNPWPADFDWFLSLVEGAGSVLDLGCGTGIFAAALAARGAEVVGVDPAAAMLEVARACHAPVTWIEARAQGLDLGRQFDAVVMTGHAFQTLLTPEDRATCLATIARHLVPGGRFFLDSRNPEARAWESWTPEVTREVRAHPRFGLVERWNDAAETGVPGVVEYQTHYRLEDGRHFAARSRIAFPGLDALSRAIAAAGLAVDQWYGDAAGGPLRPGCADFIPLGRLAD
ncbi:trans-aconitate 2-methyltransferase [Tabrizicola sp.]|uniref:class I SAM-dependent methyltransferase n=1 Tax=Tabrizicola sp. TaxID=2005166 RepID=UPI002736F968|nr:class I SAM-dependent methyltransferase [Tabrizicola sp.]MDP3194877.1 methyltransferase domain-containing protein [Tabrizicola sp.]